MLENREWEILNEIAVALYGTKKKETMRRAFLSRLMTLISFELADFSLAARKEEPYPLEDPVVVSRFDKRREAGFAELYQMGYYRLDYVNWIFSHPKSVVYRESELIDRKLRKEAPFYKDYLARYDLGSVAGVSIIADGRLKGAVTLYKSEKNGDFSERDLYILEKLTPHLQNALSGDESGEEKQKDEARRLLKYQYGVTKKELEVLTLLLQGLSNREIAAARGISLNTVKSQVADLFAKTEVKSRTQLLCFLIEKDLASPLLR